MASKSENFTKTVFLAFFLLSSGLAVPASSGVALGQFSHDVAIILQKGTAPQGGEGFFIAFVTDGKGNGPNPASSPLSEMQAQLLQGLPPVPSSQSSGGPDYIFARQGNTYVILPQAIGKNEVPSPFLQSSWLPRVWLDLAKRRSRFRICIDILEALKGGAMTPFEISFQLRLNTKRTRGYIELLAEKGLLESCAEDGRGVYVLTAKGWAFSESVRAALILDS